MLNFQIYWSFRSPYSYLAVGRIRDIAKKYNVDVQVRIVLPLAIRDPAHFTRVHPLWGMYLMRDTVRVAEMVGIDYTWPDPDPVVSGSAAGQFPKEQPYIHRLSRLGVEATNRGKGLEFIYQVSSIIWDGKTRKWNEGSHLKDAAARADLDLADMEKSIAAEPEKYDAQIESHQKELETAGHWGVPTMVFEGEPFFGQDHIDALLWRMKQKGLTQK